MMYQSLLLSMVLGMLMACQPENPFGSNPKLKQVLSPTSVELNRSWNQCNVCHSNQNLSATHAKHLTEHQASFTSNGTNLNGAVSCMDCHFNSVQHQKYTDAVGDVHYLPILQEGTKFKSSVSKKDTVYAMTMLVDELQSFIHSYTDTSTFHDGMNHFPPQKVVDAAAGGMHHDGKLDLSFAPNIVDGDSLIKYKRERAWSPTDFTCAAMKCHSGYLHSSQNKVYQWKKPTLEDDDD